MSQWAEPRVANRNGSVPVVIDTTGGGKTCKNHLIVEDILIVTNNSRTVHVCVCVFIQIILLSHFSVSIYINR